MRRAIELALRTIAALPDDGWEPETWDSFLAAQRVVRCEEVGRIDNAKVDQFDQLRRGVHL